MTNLIYVNGIQVAEGWDKATVYTEMNYGYGGGDSRCLAGLALKEEVVEDVMKLTGHPPYRATVVSYSEDGLLKATYNADTAFFYGDKKFTALMKELSGYYEEDDWEGAVVLK